MPAGDFAVLAVLAVRTVRQRYRAVCTPLWAFLQKVGKQADRETRADFGEYGRVVAANQNKINKPRSFTWVSEASKTKYQKQALKRVQNAGLAQTRLRPASHSTGRVATAYAAGAGHPPPVLRQKGTK